jgi:hypothetical protein
MSSIENSLNQTCYSSDAQTGAWVINESEFSSSTTLTEDSCFSKQSYSLELPSDIYAHKHNIDRTWVIWHNVHLSFLIQNTRAPKNIYLPENNNYKKTS